MTGTEIAYFIVGTVIGFAGTFLAFRWLVSDYNPDEPKQKHYKDYKNETWRS